MPNSLSIFNHLLLDEYFLELILSIYCFKWVNFLFVNSTFLIGPFLLKTTRTIGDKSIPSRRKLNLIHVKRVNNRKIYICNYDGEKKKKKASPFLDSFCPPGITHKSETFRCCVTLNSSVRQKYENEIKMYFISKCI